VCFDGYFTLFYDSGYVTANIGTLPFFFFVGLPLASRILENVANGTSG
jgi:hypothetical protein